MSWLRSLLDQIKMKRNKDRGGGGGTNIEKKTQQRLLEELIIEILLRLPVKSLVRFKCVCKSWLSLISNPHFATSHFNLIPVQRTRRLLFVAIHASEARSVDFQSFLNDDAATSSLDLNFLHPQSYLSLKIGGSCRGFLFLHCYHSLYLWNPSIGIYKHLPWSPIVSNVERRFFTDLYGFGYDPSTDDYLVILGSSNTTVTDDSTHLEFFSLRANTWKEIEGHFPYMSSSDNSRVGTLFNGAIHWLVFRVNISASVIVAFDLTERRISEIAAMLDDSAFYPNPYFTLKDCDLWVFKGFMSLWAMQDEQIEIWVMEEHGVSSSWSRTFVLSMDEDLGVNFYPICSTNHGDIVGFNGSTALVKYNYIEELLEHRDYYNHEFQVAFYTESLLSLPLPRDTTLA